MTKPIDQPVLSIQQLLKLPGIAIPDYQRPYKWTEINVSQLFQDIQAQQDKTAYRLGTIVFHRHGAVDEPRLDIVDGQQRTLTLLLAVWAIIESRADAASNRPDIDALLNSLKPTVEAFLAKQTFDNAISQRNLHNNYLTLKRIILRSEFSDETIEFLLKKCQVVVFELDNVEEAFQFFDSQNSRGRDLDPHDLLKAFHLREFAEHESELKAASVKHWENLNSKELASLFATYLYRTRQWAQGKTARYFTKNEVDAFKGVNIDNIGNYPYVESLRITHCFVDNYNRQYERSIDRQKLTFPFHLDQTVINGRRFFEMAEHYQQMISGIITSEHSFDEENVPLVFGGSELSESASKIIFTINTYPKNRYTGDRYVRCMFDCAMIFYIDKFGNESLSQAIEKIFIWAYRCRLKQQVVKLASMDNHVREDNLLIAIREATQPNDVLTKPLRTLADSKSSRPKLEKLFRDMNYYE